MASKSGQQEPEKAEVVEELLDALDSTLERVKVLYEQYFLGIQKQPPTFLHTDIERKVRDLAQMNIRNTGLRYRYATLSQKFGSYNSYWRRTLRQIENGTYTRNLSKIGRQAARNGAEVPDEILAAMPKRMREQVKRDRDAALANAKRRAKPVSDGSELITLSDEDVEIDVDDFEPAAFVGESSDIRRNVLTTGSVHRIEEDDEFDVDAFFARVTSEGDPNPLPVGGTVPPAKAAPAASAPRAAPAAVPPQAAPAAAPKAAPAAPKPAPRKRTGSSGHPRPASISGSWTDPSPLGGGHAPSAAPLEAARPEAAPAVAPARPTPPAMPAARAHQAPQRVPTQPGAGAPSPVPAAPAAITPAPAAKPPPMAAVRSAAPIAPASIAPSQATRPLPITPGAAAARTPAPVETMAGPFPRIPSLPPVPSPPRSPSVSQAPDLERPPPPRASRSPSIPAVPAVPVRPAPPRPAAKPPAEPAPAAAPPASAAEPTPPERPTPPPRAKRPRPPSARPVPEPRQAPPPGMSDADVNALYAKYVQAKQIVGEQADPGSYGKLLKTINAQAPKIMEQYNSKGVDFSVIVKDNQVIIRAKPKP